MATASLNPFRNPQLLSQSTGSSSRSSAVNGSSSGTTAASSGTAPEQSLSSNDDMDVLPEDAPPAYTPMADSFQGEATMAFGPQRPFQPAPPSAPVHFSTPATTLSYPPQPSVVVNMANEPIHSATRFDFPPPPRHPSAATSSTDVNPSTRHTPSVPPRPTTTSPSHIRIQSQSTPYLPPPGPPSHVRAQSYDPPSGPPPSQSFSPPTGPPPTQSFNPPTGPPPAQTFNPSTGPPPTQTFSPPPGPPPTCRSSNSMRRASGSGVGTSTVSDDGRPTTTPMPGHPLLRQGKLLVYPAGHECGKCHNTGYKNNDPSHPCSKCWDKYARSYTGALAYAPFPSPTSSNHSASGSGSNFQRPLPVFRSPQSGFFQPPHPQVMAGHRPKLHRKHSGSSSHSGHSGHGRRRHRSHSPPHHHHNRHSPPRSHHHHSPPRSHPHSPIAAFGPHMHHPPPHALPPPPHPVGHHPPRPVIYAQPGQVIPPGPSTYPPGDPRIGGRLCWRCHGRGGVSHLFFDWETCAVCSGVGRVFT